jgi:integrase/recombinase XerD
MSRGATLGWRVAGLEGDASLTWDMVTHADDEVGDAIHLRDAASKGRSGRVIPLNRELRAALV